MNDQMHSNGQTRRPGGCLDIQPLIFKRAGLTNLSTTGRLRLDLSFQVGYGSDLQQAKEVLSKLLAADERVLAEPPTKVFVQQVADSSVELAAQPFAKVEDS
jgi:small conductance mechanosensitive channel